MHPQHTLHTTTSTQLVVVVAFVFRTLCCCCRLVFRHGPCCRVIFSCYCHGGCRHDVMLVSRSCVVVTQRMRIIPRTENEKDKAKARGKGRDRSTPQHIDARTDTPLLVHCLLLFVRVSPRAFLKARARERFDCTHTSRCVVVFILLCTLSAQHTTTRTHNTRCRQQHSTQLVVVVAVVFRMLCCCRLVVLSWSLLSCHLFVLLPWWMSSCRHVGVLLSPCRRAAPLHTTTQHTQHTS